MSKNNTQSHKASPAVIAISVVAILTILAVLFVALVLPHILGVQKFKETVAATKNMSDTDILVITDSYNSRNVFEPSAEAVLGGEEAKDLASKISEVADSSKYTGSQKRTAARWDVSVSLRTDTENLTLYFSESEMYVVKNNTEFCFSPQSESEYSSLCESINKMLEKQTAQN